MNIFRKLDKKKKKWRFIVRFGNNKKVSFSEKEWYKLTEGIIDLGVGIKKSNSIYHHSD